MIGKRNYSITYNLFVKLFTNKTIKMNPLTNMKNVLKLSEQELHTSNKTSWHDQYRDSAWIFVAGFPYDLTEGDLICIFSQYGEIVHINLVRHKDTGKSRGFCFICYEDQRSTVLSVDNLNGIKILNRTVRVDHVSNYKVPKNVREEAAKLMPPPVEPTPIIKQEPVPVLDDLRETLADQITGDIKLPPRLPIYPIKEENVSLSIEKVEVKKEKKSKKDKKKKKKSKKKKKRKQVSSSGSSGDSDSESGDTKDSNSKKRRKIS